MSSGIYLLSEPNIGWNGEAALLFTSFIISIAALTYVYEGGEAFMNRRYGVPAAVRVFPAAVLIAAIFVGISRLVSFDAPIMYGFVAAFATIGAVQVNPKNEATAVTFAATSLLVLSIGAWFLIDPFRDLAGVDSETWWQSLPGETAVLIFVGGIEGLLFLLVPVRFNDGDKIFRWYKLLWASMFMVAAFFFAWVVLNPEAKAFSAILEGRVVFITCLVAAYALLATSAWAFFVFRRRPTTSF
jgi:hypothetical protein